MRGYEVVTSDDRVVGHVVDVRHGFLVVESGRIHKSRHPVPREFVHVVDEAAKAFVTVPRRILMDAPKVDKDGEFDQATIQLHRAKLISALCQSMIDLLYETNCAAVFVNHKMESVDMTGRPGLPPQRG